MSAQPKQFLLSKVENSIRQVSAQRAQDKSNRVAVHASTAIRRAGPIRMFFRKHLFPLWFKYYRLPTERSAHAHYVMYARHKGFNVDDNRIGANELFSRAYHLTPLKLQQEREKRLCLGNWLHQTRMELSPEEQNFDPFIPYMAPYIEEMRFLMQEEEELLVYHPFHRNIYKGGFSGFGEKQRYSKFLTLLI